MEGRSWQIAKKSVFLLVIKRRNGKPADGNGARTELFSVRSPIAGPDARESERGGAVFSSAPAFGPVQPMKKQEEYTKDAN